MVNTANYSLKFMDGLKPHPNYSVRHEDDRNHHWWKKVDTVAVDIYKDGKIVVIVREPDRKETILECN